MTSCDFIVALGLLGTGCAMPRKMVDTTFQTSTINV